MKTRTLAALLALLVATMGQAGIRPLYSSGTSGVSVTQANATVTFTDNHSGGTSAAFNARSVLVVSRSTSANTCFVDIEDGTATTADVPLAPGASVQFTLGANYNPPSGWVNMGAICDTGQTATFDVVATR